MVDCEDQHMVVRATPHEGESEERARAEIKRLKRFVDQEPINFGFKLSGGIVALADSAAEIASSMIR